MPERLADQVLAFEELRRVLKEGAPGAQYVASIREILEPFLVEPQRDRVVVDAALFGCSAAWLGSRYAWSRRPLSTVLQRKARELDSLRPTSQDPKLDEAIASLAAELREPFDTLHSVGRFRNQLDAFVSRPRLNAPYVDCILDAYMPAMIASHLPPARAFFLSSQMKKGAERSASELESLAGELHRRAAKELSDQPVRFSVDFDTEPAEVPLDRLGRSHLRVLLKMHVVTDETLPLRRIDIDVTFQESAEVSEANVKIDFGGIDVVIVVADEQSQGLKSKRTWSAGLKASVPGVPVTPTGEVSGSREIETASSHRVTTTETRGAVASYASTIGNKLSVTFALPQELVRGPGRDSIPFAAQVHFTAALPGSEANLEAEMITTLEAGWYKGSATYHETVTVGPVSAG